MASAMMGINDIKITMVNVIPITKVLGLTSEETMNPVSPAQMVYCYYFTVDNLDYFIADVKVMYGSMWLPYIYNITENTSMVSTLTKKINHKEG
jgi:hypothetical protein